MNMQGILTYLADLERNNNREWFHENRAQERAARAEFEALLAELIASLNRAGEALPPLNPKDLTFKMQRDTRFSHDKSPYNPAFRAHISPMGKLPVPVGYYLLVRPGDRSFLGGGLFADMFKDATNRVRAAINDNGDEWAAILRDPEFQSRFAVQGAALKRVPQGFDPLHPQAEYLKFKSWYLEVPVTDKQLLGADFVREAVDTFQKMRPFNAFLNRALEGFALPER